MLLGVDVGGTFTDAVLIAPDGAQFTAKVPTTPEQQALGVLAAVRLVLERAGAEGTSVRRFAHGMTVATNALLEGRAARTALLATEGFTDVIELGRQARASLYDLCAAAPPPLVPAELRFGAPERMGAAGETLRELSRADAAALAVQAAGAAPEAVAVCLLHSYANPAHERLLAEQLARALPQASVSVSSELVGTFREFERTATTVLDAALSPLLAGYLRALARSARAERLPEPQIMQSSGGLADAPRAASHAALTVLSGPAGGVAGAALLADRAGEQRVLCLDMGGTSCDVCAIERGRVGETAERRIAGRPLALPALDIHTVGAGGGSIAWRDAGGALRVGPRSAGARPGPACYGLGGREPTVTDANLLLGRLPAGAVLAGGIELDLDAAARAVGGLAGELGLGALQCAEGIVRVAEAEMLGALRVMTVERGIDPRGFALLAFGGAGGLHAAALAEQLGIARVLCPRASGVLSALGLAAAAPRRDVSRTVMLAGPGLTARALAAARAALVRDALELLGEPPARVRARYELRYSGQSFELPVEEELSPQPPAAVREVDALDPAALREAFEISHERLYGYREPEGAVELVNLRASVWGRAVEVSLERSASASHVQAGGRAAAAIVFAGERIDAQLLAGEPPAGTHLDGPALLALPDATVLVPPGWDCRIDELGTALLERRAA